MSIVLDNISVTHGLRKRNQVRALDGISVTVPHGSIFGLLGPSGCGKTTFVEVALGIRKPDAGSGPVRTCGRPPLYPGHGVPGPLVGYMPQEHTLHCFFAAREVLVYYGRVLNVPNLEDKVSAVMKLLDLDDKKLQKRQVTKLSGGQRRRLSLACAMIHEPRILVLDEPTVGVDPVLRQTIWRHLRTLAARQTTVLITTHYMEECSNANEILFLRQGRVMGQGTPTRLKELYDRDSLDDVFLKMCKNAEGINVDNASGSGSSSDNERMMQTSSSVTEETTPLLLTGDSIMPTCESVSVHTGDAFKALIYKNLMVLRRHTTFMLFNIMLPVLAFICFIAAIGNTIRSLKVGIVNEEVGIGGCEGVENVTCPDMSDPSSIMMNGLDLGSNLSCHFLKHIDTFVFGRLTERTQDDAHAAVVSASDHGYLRIHEGFSEALSDRMEAIITSSNISSETLNMAKIKLTADATNVEVYRAMQLSVLRSAESFFLWYADECSIPGLADQITHSGIAVHNVREDEGIETTTNLAHGMLPGMIAMILNMLAMALTADQLATEREERLFQRDFVCGVPVMLIMITQMIVQLVVVFGQLLFSLIVLNFVFPSLPGYFYVFLSFLYLLQSICGMTMGFFISTLCKRRDQVMQLGSGIVFPAFIMSGILWPRIAMPPFLRVISVMLPVTITADVAKYVVLNETLEAPNIGWGIAVPIIWAIGLFMLTLGLQMKTVISNTDVIKYRLGMMGETKKVHSDK